MFTDVYLRTTDPTVTFSQMIRASIEGIVLSTLFHTLIYCIFANLASYVFLGAILSSTVQFRLAISLLLIMFFGYMARFFHVKEIFQAYHHDKEKTREHLDKLYISWIFIG